MKVTDQYSREILPGLIFALYTEKELYVSAEMNILYPGFSFLQRKYSVGATCSVVVIGQGDILGKIGGRGLQ